MEEKKELMLIGKIDNIELYYNPYMKENEGVTGFNEAELPKFTDMKVNTKCKCETCKCNPTAKSAGKTYNDIKFVVRGTKDLEEFQKHLDKQKKILS